MARISCYRCQQSWETELPIARSEECPSCHFDAKVCFNCVFYDQQAYRECKESQASWVKEKDRANFCGYFLPLGERSPEKKNIKDEIKNKLDDLFKK